MNQDDLKRTGLALIEAATTLTRRGSKAPHSQVEVNDGRKMDTPKSISWIKLVCGPYRIGGRAFHPFAHEAALLDLRRRLYDRLADLHAAERFYLALARKLDLTPFLPLDVVKEAMDAAYAAESKRALHVLRCLDAGRPDGPWSVSELKRFPEALALLEERFSPPRR